MGTIFKNTENSKANEPHKFFLNLSRMLDLRNSNKLVALQNLSIYYTQKNISKQHKKNNFKIMTLTWNDKFQLSDSSYSN